MRKSLAIILAAVMMLSLAVVGVSAADPEVITTAEQFAAIKVDGNYKLGADIAVATTLVFKDAEDKEVGFSGTLDGAGHKITVSAPIFSRLSGTVKNLVIEGAVSATGTSEHCAPLALRGSGTVVLDNILNKASVTTAYRGAGIISQIDNGSNATIKNCTNEGKVVNTGEASSMIGGIIAYQQGNTLDLSNCVNHGEITSAYGLAGGVMGRYGGDDGKYNPEKTVTITNCLNDGAVTGSSQVGGILAHGRSSLVTISNCTNKGKILSTYRKDGTGAYVLNSSGNKQGTSDASGIFGSTAGSDGHYCVVLISKCLNEGDVTSDNARASGICSYVWCGNQGDNYPHAEVTDCVNKGNIAGGSFVSQIVTYTNDTKDMGGAKQSTKVGGVGLGTVSRAADTLRDADKTYLSIVGVSSAATALNYDFNLVLSNTDKSTWVSYSEGTEGNRHPISELPDTIKIVTPEEAETAAKALGAGASGTIGYVAPSDPSQGGSTVVTGDTAVIVMIVAAVSLLGMGIALKARKA